MADSSFDIVSKVDDMEVQNAMGQAQKEIQQRYDFKNVGASLEFSGEKILMKANAEERVKAVLEVFEQKLIKRGISLRSLDAGKPFASGKEYRIEASIKHASRVRMRRRSARSFATRDRRASRARSRATNCACSRRAATTCNRCRRCSRAKTSTSPCSS
jgi:uncharacterized protein YajQ (UPF0234 family)